MRNLKRALSLALASVMVASMTLIGAGAVSADDFSDSADIVNKEAVTVLATLGVITGNDDGSYAPADTISRAEMSTIICRVLNGGKDPVLGEAVTNTYTDTASHWAKNYIEYCTTLGIIAGKGDGTFDPEGDVTVSEAAKMVLVALGYNAAMEGYTGGAWQINVDARANPLGLYDDLSYTTTNAPLTRDNAAQMLYNALDCDMVKYDVVLDTTSSTVISTTQLGETGETLLEDKFEAVKVEGVVIANEVANLESTSTNGSSLAANRTKIRIDEEADQDYYTGDETFSVASSLDELGRYVAIYVKKDRNAINAQVLGSVIVSEDNKVITDASTDSIRDVADDNDLDLTSDTRVAKNYQGLTGLGSLDDVDGIDGVEKILIDNDDDGDVDYVLLNTYYFGKVVTYVDSGDGSIAIDVGATESTNYYTKSVTRLTADDKDDVVGFEDVARGDYVNAQFIGGDLHVSVAETVVGVLDSYKSTNPTEEVTVDGETYQVSNVLGYIGGDDDIRMAADEARDYVKEEAAFYLDNNGYVVAFGEAEAAAGRYAMVMAKGTDVNDLVKVALADGTIATYTVNDSGNGIKKDSLEIGGVYAYSISADDEIKLTRTDMTTDAFEIAGAATTFEKGKIAIRTSDGKVYYAASRTAFFYVNDADGKIVDQTTSIANDDVETYASYESAPDVDAAKGVTVWSKGDRVVAVVFAGDDLVQANVDDNLYVSKVISTDGDETTVEAYVNGSAEVQTITVDGTDVAVRNTYTYTIKDGVYNLSRVGVTIENENSADTVTYVDGRNFVVGGQNYVITSDTVIVNHSEYLPSVSATLGTDGSVNLNDRIIGLVADGNDALMVVVRNKEVTTPGDDSGTTSATYGNYTLIANKSFTGFSATVTGGNLIFQFSPSVNAAKNATYTFNYSVEKDGTEIGSGTAPAIGADNTSTRVRVTDAGTYTSDDVLTIRVTNLMPTAYAYSAADSITITGVDNGLTSANTGATTSFTVKGLTGVSQTDITYTLTNVSLPDGTPAPTKPGAAITNGVYTYTEENVAVTSGKTGTITTEALYATGRVTLTVTVGDATEQTVTYVVEGLDGVTASGTNSLTTDSTTGGNLGTITLTGIPANVASYDYTVSFTGIAAVDGSTLTCTDDDATGNTITAAPFNGSTAVYATGPVTVTITISDVKTEYTFDSVRVETASRAYIKGAGLTWTFDSQSAGDPIGVNADGTFEGDLAATGMDALTVPGTVTLEVLNGAELDGPFTAKLERGATSIDFSGVKLKNVTGMIIFQVTFEAAQTYTLEWDDALKAAATVGSSTDKYHISASTVSGEAFTEGNGVAEGEEVVITITGTETTPSSWTDTGEISVLVNGDSAGVTASGSGALSNGGTRTFTFTMPAEPVTLTLTYTP